MDRRKFIAGVASGTVMGTAGCVGLFSDDTPEFEFEFNGPNEAVVDGNVTVTISAEAINAEGEEVEPPTVDVVHTGSSEVVANNIFEEVEMVEGKEEIDVVVSVGNTAGEDQFVLTMSGEEVGEYTVTLIDDPAAQTAPIEQYEADIEFDTFSDEGDEIEWGYVEMGDHTAEEYYLEGEIRFAGDAIEFEEWYANGTMYRISMLLDTRETTVEQQDEPNVLVTFSEYEALAESESVTTLKDGTHEYVLTERDVDEETRLEITQSDEFELAVVMESDGTPLEYELVESIDSDGFEDEVSVLEVDYRSVNEPVPMPDIPDELTTANGDNN